MLRQKAFFKVTGKGNVTKVIKEHYLRTDIPCGVEGCTSCAPFLEPLMASSAINLLNPSLRTHINDLVPQPHVILLDTNILLHHFDALETPFLQDIVLLQTVLDEVKSNSLAVYKRIRTLISQPGHRFFVFSNEHHRDTFVEKVPRSIESANDHNDKSIRKAAAWYAKHLIANDLGNDGMPWSVVLLTNDMANAQLAQTEGIMAMRLVDYCQGFTGQAGAEALLDMLEGPATGISSSMTGTAEVDYEEHLPTTQLQAGLAAARYFKGSLQVSPYDRLHGSITIANGGGVPGITSTSGTLATIKVLGWKNLNRALPGDQVVIELLPKEEWSTSAAESILADDDASNVSSGGDGKTVPSTGPKDEGEDLLSFPAKETVAEEDTTILPVTATCVPLGRVVGILRRALRTYCGSLDRKTIREEGAEGSVQSVLVHVLDRRLPRIRIRTRNARHLATQRILIAIDGWERTSRYPHGHLVRILGQTGDRATETEVILLEHDVSYQDFTPQVLACLPTSNWIPTPEDYAEREDFRQVIICSIDPPGCTDIDDALHARQLEDGTFEVGVHIADVTHFVRANTPLDNEAASRSTTVYLVDRRIDMLPSLLGTNLCSLKCGVERLAFSVIWQMDSQAQVLNTRFCKSIIKSKASFTYDEAQRRLDKPEDPSTDDDGDKELTRSLHILNGLARQLRIQRVEAGALTLASPEVRFTLETETMNPVDVILKEMKEANSLVEEFMLLANISVAQRIYQAFPETAILRRHPPPPLENFNALNQALAIKGFHLETSSSKALAQSLDRIIDPQDGFFNRLVRIMTTRCLYQAQYFAAGSHPYDGFWHYGLACSIYTHFTSPIRRYADVLVHRLLAAACLDKARYGGSSVAWDQSRLEEICDNMNYRHRMAQQAQRSSIELFTHLFFKDRAQGTTGALEEGEEAYVMKIMSNGLIALIPKFGIEGMIRLEEFGPLRFDTENGSLIVGEAHAQPITFQLFQKIKIILRVEEVESTQRQKLIINIVEPQLLRVSEKSQSLAVNTSLAPGLKRISSEQ